MPGLYFDLPDWTCMALVPPAKLELGQVLQVPLKEVDPLYALSA